MCGIVGYTGKKDSVPVLIQGLERLAYRGYDSAGIAVWDGENIVLRKEKGRIAQLQDVLEREPVSGGVGIGHTRWATHGEPSFVNAHPHTDQGSAIALVHNGIIENYAKLKQMLTERGVRFASQTDTEVIAQLLGYYYKGDIKAAILQTLSMLEGSYALAILCKDDPDTIYCTCKDNPLVVGMGTDGGYIASDIPAILEYTRDVCFMKNQELVEVSPYGLKFYDALGNPLQKERVHIDWDVESAQKGNYEHFMLKEIHEEPTVLRETFRHYVGEEGVIRQDRMPLNGEEARELGQLRIVACGSAYHAGLVGKTVIERMARLPVEVDIASEFRYRDPILRPDEMVAVISQSGETADTIAAMRLVQERGLPVTAICNVVGSTISREATRTMLTLAGPEIAVATTKAYLTQLLTLYILALDLAVKRGCMHPGEQRELLEELSQMAEDAERLIGNKETIQYFASRFFDREHVFYIGRGLDYSLAMEAALKLKEISYIHSEAYAAGELKHGTIALIEQGTLVVAMATQQDTIEKMASNVEEVKVRGAKILAIMPEGCEALDGIADEIWRLPARDDRLLPLSAIVPMQLFAYYMAVQKGCDVDKPRNLAKSVTVE